MSARGVRFHVADLGRDVQDTGPGPLVMLHGLFTGSAASWFFTVAPALARTRPVRLLDWRGHGMSERTPTGYDSATMADDLAELTADLPPFAIAGHSYGAVVAVRFALDRPGRVTRLAFIDPPFGRLPSGVFGERLFGRAAPGRRRPARRGMDRLLADTSVLADLAAERPVTAAELGALGALPVLAVAGAESPFRGSCELVGRALPSSRCHVLPGGHDLHITAQALLEPLLETFMAEAEEAHA